LFPVIKENLAGREDSSHHWLSQLQQKDEEEEETGTAVTSVPRDTAHSLAPLPAVKLPVVQSGTTRSPLRDPGGPENPQEQKKVLVRGLGLGN
jgi:hypothetical protein